ncbi:MAG TPA: flagellar hook-length control protein FliK [Bacillales bacterium]|nr:flagellar hook-length control protein FliK [Bacillales bacterium]
MNGSTISSTVPILKAGEKRNAGSIQEPTRKKGSLPFDKTLGELLSNHTEKNQSDPLKKILNKLMNLIEKVSLKTNGKELLPKDAEKAVQLLKDALHLLKSQEKPPHPHTKDLANELELFQFAIGQFQQLFSQNQAKNTSVVEPQTTKALLDRIEKAITKLLGDEKRPASKLSTAIVNQVKANKGFVSNQQLQGANQTGKGQKPNAGSGLNARQQIPVKSDTGAMFKQTVQMSDQKDAVMTAFQKLVKTKDQGNQTPVQSFQPGPMTKLQQFVLHVKQNNGVPNQKQFVHDFEQMLAKGSFTNIGGKQQLTLQLHPQHLGKLNIQLIRENGQLTATLVASTSEAKSLVQSNLHQLQGAFTSQNLNVQKLQVIYPFAQADAQQQAQNYNDSEKQEHQQHQAYEQENDQNEDADNGFSKWLEQLDLQIGQEVRL